MITHRDIWDLTRRPSQYLEERLAEPPTPRQLLLGIVTPLTLIRAVAVLVRSLIVGELLAGFVLGVGSFVLQLGAWLGLALVMPAIARQFAAEISDRQSFALATFASIPMWVAGVLYGVPDDPWYIYFWSRALMLGIGLYGLYILRRGFVLLGLDKAVRTPLTVAVTVAFTTLYVFLFILLGIASHLLLVVIT